MGGNARASTHLLRGFARNSSVRTLSPDAAVAFSEYWELVNRLFLGLTDPFDLYDLGKVKVRKVKLT